MTGKRFEVIHRDSVFSGPRVLRDNMTGVLYVSVSEGFGGGITVLVDRDGKPIVDEHYVQWLDSQNPAS
ncbi:DUF6440 family protein [Microbacterium sp. YY-01]|uniref:DUF6440 family protein n=1 Tax=Microbacterium sp. YY-01 TaxID=3421634 RepID=UPI003D16E1A6